jgi:signal transduction histidine kinase
MDDTYMGREAALKKPDPLARRIHDRVLGLLGTALMKTEMCETLGRLGRQDEIPATLTELRSALEQTVLELREIMAELRTDANLKNPAA